MNDYSIRKEILEFGPPMQTSRTPQTVAAYIRKCGPWVPITAAMVADTGPLRAMERRYRAMVQRESDRWHNLLVYGWVPPRRDPNPMPRFRLWRWWP